MIVAFGLKNKGRDVLNWPILGKDTKKLKRMFNNSLRAVINYGNLEKLVGHSKETMIGLFKNNKEFRKMMANKLPGEKQDRGKWLMAPETIWEYATKSSNSRHAFITVLRIILAEKDIEGFSKEKMVFSREAWAEKCEALFNEADDEYDVVMKEKPAEQGPFTWDEATRKVYKDKLLALKDPKFDEAGAKVFIDLLAKEGLEPVDILTTTVVEFKACDLPNNKGKVSMGQAKKWFRAVPLVFE